MSIEFHDAYDDERANSVDRLDLLRGQVSAIDQEILRLVESRTALALAVDAEKTARGEPTIATDRRTETIGDYMGRVRSEGPLEAPDAAMLGEIVMKIAASARRRQNEADREQPGARLQRVAEEAGESLF